LFIDLKEPKEYIIIAKEKGNIGKDLFYIAIKVYIRIATSVATLFFKLLKPSKLRKETKIRWILLFR